MPLIRKPATVGTPAVATPAVDVVKALGSSDTEERWAAAREAANDPGCASALVTALRAEVDPRVREAMFTSLARIGSPETMDAVLEFLRSDDASIRGGTLDALRLNVGAIRAHLSILLNNNDPDVRILSCELARSLPSEEATRILSNLLAAETEVNVCAAAIDVLAEVGRPEALSVLSQCEARFKDTPFLMFAIKIAKDRCSLSTIST